MQLNHAPEILAKYTHYFDYRDPLEKSYIR
jgi:hypothetical protein